MIAVHYGPGGSKTLKNSTKSSVAVAMSGAALAIFGVLGARDASASFHACDDQQYRDCGTYCSQRMGDDHSCCGVADGGGGSFCLCFSDPVDCSPFFS